jgi:FkbM family methyltransferase
VDLWSLRRLGRHPALRRAVRQVFRWVWRHGRVYRIASGPLRGRRWYHHRDHPFWMPLGQYERETAEWLSSVLRPGATFFDVGAHAGYFTLLGALRVGEAGRVVAFEPVAQNRDVIARQLALNGLANGVVEASALSDREGMAWYRVTENVANAHLAEVEVTHAAPRTRELVEVATQRLDGFVARTGLQPDVIKLDVEGAEVAVLEGARATLAGSGPALLVSTHSAELKRRCRELLESLGYSVEPLRGFEHELVARRPDSLLAGDSL